MSLEVLYENGPCLVVQKPAGVLSQAPPGIDSMEVRVRALYKQREGKSGNIYVGVPHRLDRPVSGAMVFARHVRAAQRLARQFAVRTVQKTYWAIVAGRPQESTGTWSDTLRKIPGRARAEVVDTDHPEGRIAILHFQVQREIAGHAFLEIQLETGRTHQIRIQAASRGMPILGDTAYGSTFAFGPEVADPRDQMIALHGRRIQLEHPMIRGLQIDVTAELPSAWQLLLGS